jgi:hypothetical protein
MSGQRIAIRGYRLDKHGRLIKSVKHLDVCTRLKQASSKKVRVVRKGTA